MDWLSPLSCNFVSCVKQKRAFGLVFFLIFIYDRNKPIHPVGKGGILMKNHRFWAWAAIVCMAMVMITGYRHK